MLDRSQRVLAFPDLRRSRVGDGEEMSVLLTH
jgi:hypothetical protein